MLASVPLVLGGLLELPLGVLAGQGRRRRAAVLGGGVLFVLAVAGVAFARNFGELLAAFVAFYPASGAFVSLTQAALMDTAPDRQAQSMARWDLAGSAGAVAGPLLLLAVLAAGGSWRGGFLTLAVISGLAWAGVLGQRRPAAAGDPGAGDSGSGDSGSGDSGSGDSGSGDSGSGESGAPEAGDEPTPRLREIIVAARRAARWLVLLEVTNLLVDVLTGFVAVYLVNVVHLTPAVAAVAVAIRLGAALAGDAVLVMVLERVSDRTVLRGTAIGAIVAYPAFLLAPGVVPRLIALALLSAVTATWYPLLQARLYATVPSPVAVTLNSAAGLAGGLGPLAVGVVAAMFGLPWALAGLAVVPLALLFAT